MIKTRNASSHEYNMEKVDVISENISTAFYSVLSDFSEQVKGF